MITTVIPIHNNSPQRDLKRLYYQLLSLSNQTIPCNVVISTDSNDVEVKAIELIVLEMSLKAQSGTWIKVIRHEPQYQGEMNLPYLINRGIEATDSEWLLVTGIDFIYSPDCLKNIVSLAVKNTLVINYVRMMQSAHYSKMNDSWVNEWKFPGHYQRNGGNQTACGVVCFRRELFDITGGSCEQMRGFSGADEDFKNRSGMAGYKIIWNDNQVVHLPHASGKNNNKPSRLQRRNWAIRDMLKEHNIVDWREFRKFPRW